MTDQSISYGDAPLGAVLGSDVGSSDVAVPAPIAELPPEPLVAEGSPEAAPLPLDAGGLDGVTITAGARYDKDIFVAHGVYVDVPDVDLETSEQKRDSAGNPLTVQVERAFDRDHYVTELGPNERGNLLVGAGTPVPAEVAELLQSR